MKEGPKEQRKRSKMEEEVSNLFYKPHTISALLLGGAGMVYFAFTRDDDSVTQNNVKTYVCE